MSTPMNSMSGAPLLSYYPSKLPMRKLWPSSVKETSASVISGSTAIAGFACCVLFLWSPRWKAKTREKICAQAGSSTSKTQRRVFRAGVSQVFSSALLRSSSCASCPIKALEIKNAVCTNSLVISSETAVIAYLLIFL